MKTVYLILIFIVGLFYSLSGQNPIKPSVNLRKLNSNEMIEFARNGIYPSKTTLYKNINGEIINKIDTIDYTESFYDYYVNSDNRIIECIIRPISQEDIALWKRMVDVIEEKRWGTINLIAPDCNTIKDTLEKVLIRDQEERQKGSINIKDDKKNLEIVIGIIEKCGFPTLNKVGKDGMRATFLILQHGTRKLKEKYFPLLVESAKKGEISLRAVAMMEDRIHMESCEKQIYGTQFTTDQTTGKLKLYPLRDIDKVNERRFSMGLDSIEISLREKGIKLRVVNK